MAGDENRLYKIGEVCKIADVQPYVLRYWETEFPALAPNKSGGGPRWKATNMWAAIPQHEIDIILRIKQLLYSEGFTIAGAKKKLEGEPESPGPGRPKKDLTRALLHVRDELRKILQMLDAG